MATALAISRWLQETTNVTIRTLIDTLEPLHQITITLDGHPITAKDPIPDTARHILTSIQDRTKPA